MAEYEPGGALAKRHVFAPGLDEPLVTYAGGAKTFHVADERGSVVAATDAAGMVVTSWGYGPHGEPDARGMAPSFGFTGALTLPQLGLTAMRARVYSHRLGRFLQPDPIGQAGGINLYDYAGGDPVNGWDPWGLCGSRLPGHSAAGCVTIHVQDVQGKQHRKGTIEGPGGYWKLVSADDNAPSWRFITTASPPAVGHVFGFSFGGIGGMSGGIDRDASGTPTEEPVDAKPPAFCSSMTWRGLDALQQGAQAGAVLFGAATLANPGFGTVALGALGVDVLAAFGKAAVGDTDSLKRTAVFGLLGLGAGKVFGEMAGTYAQGVPAAGAMADVARDILGPRNPCAGVGW